MSKQLNELATRQDHDIKVQKGPYENAEVRDDALLELVLLEWFLRSANPLPCAPDVHNHTVNQNKTGLKHD